MEQIAGLRAQTGMEGFQPRCSRQLAGRPWEKQSKDCRLFFLHPQHSARWHGGTHAASNVCQSAATAGATERRRLGPHVEPVLTGCLNQRSVHICSYNLQEYGVLKEDSDGEYWCSSSVKPEQQQTCTVLRFIPFLSVSAGFEHADSQSDSSCGCFLGGCSLKNLLDRTWDQTVSGCFRIDLGSKFHEHKHVSALWPFFTSQRLKDIFTLHPPSLNNARANNSQHGDGRLLLFLKYVVPFPLQPEPTAGMSYFLLWRMDKEGRCRVNYFST